MQLSGLDIIGMAVGKSPNGKNLFALRKCRKKTDF